MDSIIILADHNVGFLLTEFLLDLNRKNEIRVIAIYTNCNIESVWWKKIESLNNKYNFILKFFTTNEVLYSEIKNLKVDYLFLFSWRHIITNQIINIPQKGCVNLHYSLLPKYRGVYPVNWQIINGENIAGVTFHYVEEGIDSGDIIAQEQLFINSWETSFNLLVRLDELAFELFKKIFFTRDFWKQNAKKQLIENVRYYSKKDFIECNELDLEKTFKAIDLINLMRGKTFKPYNNNLYFIDEKTGEKVFISLVLEKNS